MLAAGLGGKREHVWDRRDVRELVEHPEHAVASRALGGRVVAGVTDLLEQLNMRGAEKAWRRWGAVI
jgi:hypothetical protein